MEARNTAAFSEHGRRASLQSFQPVHDVRRTIRIAGAPAARPDTARVVRIMAARHGHDLSIFDDAHLTRMIAAQAVQCGQEMPRYVESLEQNAEQALNLLAALNVSYSEFFRDLPTFSILEHRLLPAIIDKAAASGRRELRIWSAACAAGQETYSLAIVLDALLATTSSDTEVRILGTDHDPDNLITADRGRYASADLGNVRLHHLQACFTRHGNDYEVIPRIRAMVDFVPHALHAPQGTHIPDSDFDLIVCSNLLIYYTRDIQGAILERLHAGLAPTGYLVTADMERDIIHQSDRFSQAVFGGPIFHKTRG